MDRFAAHYIFTGKQVLRKAVLTQNSERQIVSLSNEDAMAIEYSNTIFFNGIICPEFVSYSAETVPDSYTVLDAQHPIPLHFVHPDRLLIRFNEYDENALFAYFESLQKQFNYTFFDLLKVICNTNYIAQELEAPVIEIGQVIGLNLISKLNLVDGRFISTSRLKKLS